jgi:Reverse transcriptase (RNA-dependent DNA polymerase)
VLNCLVNGYGDPVWASRYIWVCFWTQHSILLRLLWRVIEGGGILLALVILSLLQNYPCIDHPLKDTIRLRTGVFHQSSNGYGSVMGLRPPRRRREYQKRYIHQYLTMTRLRFSQVRNTSYRMHCWVKHLHDLTSLSRASQPGDNALKGLATPIERPEQRTALERDEPTGGHPGILVDNLLHRIDPITWYRGMKLCERILQGRANTAKQLLVLQADLSREKLDRPQAWSPTENPGRVYLSEGIAEKEVPIILDTGASFSLSPFKSDFIKGPSKSQVSELTGITDTVKVEGVGVVEWPIVDIFGQSKIIRTHAYYVPQADIRLFSPQTYLQENRGGECVVTYSHVTLTTPDGIELQFPYNHKSNIPFMCIGNDPLKEAGLGTVHFQALDEAYGDPEIYSLLDLSNLNLKANQKELLLWHWRLMHAGQSWIQSLMATPKQEVGEKPPAPLIQSKVSGTSSCDHPVCQACQLGKQHRRTPGRTWVDPDQEMAIRRENLQPGDCTSIDQYVSAMPGRLAHTFGRESADRQYNGGTIFVDHATSFVFIRNQQSLRIGETLQAKRTYEKFAGDFGIKLKNFRADNAPFRATEFVEDLALKNQDIDYSGVGAHFQNGVAERALQTITKWARSAMLHQALHWPTEFLPDLWPFALEHAVHIWNHLPSHHSKLAPIELFTGVKLPEYKAISQARIWGCPVYVLDPSIQDGKKLPKWRARSRVGMYLGASNEHSSTVGRILNLTTRAISPQYHVVYDELFSSVETYAMNDDKFDPATWNELVQTGLERQVDYEDITVEGEQPRIPFQEMFDDFIAGNPLAGEDDSSDSGDSLEDPTPSTPRRPHPIETTPQSTEGATTEEEAPSVIEGAIEEVDPYPYRRKSPRKKQPPQRWEPEHLAQLTRAQKKSRAQQRLYLAGGCDYRKVRCGDLQAEHLHKLDWSKAVNLLRSRDAKAVLTLLDSFRNPEDPELMEDWTPMALAAKASDEDTPNWAQAMNGPNREGFWDACQTEFDTLKGMDTWDVVNRESWMNVLPSTWAFKIKRFPNGLVKKLKARFCARGDKQIEGVDFFDTFAPVVSWTTVRLMLILSAILNLNTRQADYTAAFVHAPIDRDPNYDSLTPEEQRRQGVYVEMPRGFSQQGKVLRLKKSLYGLKQSPRNFFQHLKSKLESIGFEAATDVDSCLFISDKVICLCYVDDTLLFSPEQKWIDEAIDKLKNTADLSIEIEDDVAGFLGVSIKRDDAAGTVTLTQTGLIDRIIEALEIDGLPPKETPADEVLTSDKEGDPPNGTFNYASVIGMMWYLYGHSRPDLGFALSQAARFSHSPKRSHELALIRIGQYLKGTRDKGLILRPHRSELLKVDCYVDADFCGLYGREDRTDPTSVKSRTGYVICIAGCPVIWSSKLQESIALSTMMAEYYALSTAMREVLPLNDLVKVIATALQLDEEHLTSFNTTVWEDNNGALSLAILDPGQHTPRSKHYDIKVHWFRSHLKPNKIVVEKIDTSLQQADIFTKPLPVETFVIMRRLLMGW